jgi:hypothetical protein
MGEKQGSAQLDSTLVSTVDGFAVRLRRRLDEQAENQSRSAREASERHALMLRALSSMRKALQEAAKLGLGDRFRFRLNVTDWEGWPKVELQLVDVLNASEDLQALIVHAHDRNESGTVQISLRTGEVLARVRLQTASEFDKLPVLLKRSVRHFLDIVMSNVLAPKPADEIVGAPLAMPSEDPPDSLSQSLKNESVFVDPQEAARGSDNVVDLYTEVRPLEVASALIGIK